MKFAYLPIVASILLAAPLFAQSEETATDAQEAPEAAAEDGAFTEAELQKLVAPVALYPDTLLIQILVAATEPLEVVKADKFLGDNEGVDPVELKPEIEAQQWDASVEVLATGFPNVINGMATHIEWTETMGDAMNAQSDDVMDAVQVMRDQAINSGALISTEEQVVETDEEDNIVIVPADPEVVYVPEYDATKVYEEDNTGDLIAAGLIGFGFALIIDDIFDDDDDWNDYWYCHNCGGWNGRPIVRDPDIDIDINGDVNIGNNNVQGWKADVDRSNEARVNVAEKRNEDGSTRAPLEQNPSRNDDLRNKLSESTGAADISRPENREGAERLENRDGNTRPADRGDVQVNRPENAAGTGDALARTREGGGERPAIQQPSTAQRPQPDRERPAAGSGGRQGGSALKQHSGGSRASAASSRGGGRAAAGNRRR